MLVKATQQPALHVCACKHTHIHTRNQPSESTHTCTRLHIFVGTWHVRRRSCPFACSRTRLPKMSHWIFNMCANLMMAETQSMALIIPASTAESSRPPQGLWLLPQNLLTSISLPFPHPSISAPLGSCHLWPCARSSWQETSSNLPSALPSLSASQWH